MTATPHSAGVWVRLVEEVRAAQAADPFRRVTVLIPHRAVALDVMRHLAATGGVVNVHPVTLTDLARELLDDAGALVGREPLTRSALQEAITTELAREPRSFAPVADQPATIDALVDASLDLLRAAHLPQPGEEAGALPPMTADALAIHRAVQPRLSGHYSAHHLLVEATQWLRSNAAARDRLGAVVLFHFPPQHDPASEQFFELLRGTAHAVIDPVTLSAEEVRTHPAALVSVTDPVEECRLAVESVAQALAEGIPGHRIGIFFPTASPYVGALTALLTEAGITFTAPGTTPATASPLARTLLALLRADAEALDLRLLLDAVWEGVGTRLLGEEAMPSSARLERAYVAGFGSGADAWEEDEDSPPASSRQAQLAADWRALQQAAEAVTQYLHAVDAAPGWSEAVAAIEDFAAALAPRGEEGARQCAQVRAALDSVGGSAALPHPGRPLLARHLFAELAAQQPRHGTLREGVVVGTFASAVARDLQVVHVLGLADGIAPAPATVDPIFPDQVRDVLGGGLRTTQQIRTDQERDFRQALCAGRRIVLTTPRGRLREAGPLEPSPLLCGKAPSVVLASPLAGLRDGYGAIREDAAPAEASPLAASAGRAWHRMLLREEAPRHDGPPSPSAVDSLPAAALRARDMRRDRTVGRFTRFTGDVSVLGDAFTVLTHGPADGAAEQPRGTSASALQQWVSQPHDYFLERVLGGEIFAYPDEEDAISALDFGTLVHAALEDLVRELLRSGSVPAPDRVESIVAARCEEMARVSWNPARWAFDQQRALTMVEHVAQELREEAARPEGWRPVAAESAFGPGPEDEYPPLPIQLSSGIVHLRGKVDRLDRKADGSVRVLDYKTGKNTRYRNIAADETQDNFDPTAGGTQLQLPIYSLHALTQVLASCIDEADGSGDDTPAVESVYRFLADGTEIAVPWTPAVREDVLRQLERITTAIGQGLFPIVAAPEPHDDRETWTTLAGQRASERLTAALRMDPRVAAALGITTEEHSDA